MEDSLIPDQNFDDALPTTTKRVKSDKKVGNVRHAEQMMLSAMVFDVDCLLKKFNEVTGTSFYEFGQIFIDREFPTIFLGRFSTTEMVEFSEILLSYAASFIFSIKDNNLNPPFLTAVTQNDLKKIATARKEHSLKERIFGVYLTYCLYFTQPQTHIANIKLTVLQMKELRSFCQGELMAELCHEALFCINRLVDQHAFMIVPFEKEFNPLLSRRFNLDNMVSDNFDISDSMGNEVLPALKNIEKDYTLMQTDIIHKRYIAEKSQLMLSTGLNTVTDNLLSKISEIVARTERELESMQ